VKTRIGLLLSLLLGACAARAVHCDRHLTPINAPAKTLAAARPAARGAR